MDDEKRKFYSKVYLNDYFPLYWRLGQLFSNLMFGISILPLNYFLYKIKRLKNLDEEEKKIGEIVWTEYTKSTIPWIVSFYLITYFSSPNYYKKQSGEIEYNGKKIKYFCNLGIAPEERINYFTNIALFGEFGKANYLIRKNNTLECFLRENGKEEQLKIKGNYKILKEYVENNKKLEELLKQYFKRKELKTSTNNNL